MFIQSWRALCRHKLSLGAFAMSITHLSVRIVADPLAAAMEWQTANLTSVWFFPPLAGGQSARDSEGGSTNLSKQPKQYLACTSGLPHDCLDKQHLEVEHPLHLSVGPWGIISPLLKQILIRSFVSSCHKHVFLSLVFLELHHRFTEMQIL